MRKRSIYIIVTIILFIVEVMIARYVHDAFIRPYVGDVLVVIVLYCFVRIWIPDKIKLLPLYIFIFAAGVEILQYLHIAERFGVQDNRFLNTLIGSTFDGKDIICYAIGCGFLILQNLLVQRTGLDEGVL